MPRHLTRPGSQIKKFVDQSPHNINCREFGAVLHNMWSHGKTGQLDTKLHSESRTLQIRSNFSEVFAQLWPKI